MPFKTIIIGIFILLLLQRCRRLHNLYNYIIPKHAKCYITITASKLWIPDNSLDGDQQDETPP